MSRFVLFLLLAIQHWMDTPMKTGEDVIIPVAGAIEAFSVPAEDGSSICGTGTFYVNGKEAGVLHSPEKASDRPVHLQEGDTLTFGFEHQACAPRRE